MTKVKKKQRKGKQSVMKKATRKPVKSKLLRKLQKSRPKRYMNPFLCFAHELRKKAKGVHSGSDLLSDWKAAHKGLGAKWRALGAKKSMYFNQGKVPAFALFVKENAERKQVLPLWRAAHKGLGGKWRGMDNVTKAKYVTASKQMKGTYDQQMKVYRKKRQELVKSIRASRMAKKASTKERMVQAKKAKVARRKASKTLKRKGGLSLKKVKKAKSSLMKKGKKAKSLKQRQSKSSKVNKKGIARKINARVRVTRISSTNLPI